MLYAFTNAMLMVVIKFVPDTVFADPGTDVAGKILLNTPVLGKWLASWFPHIQAPSSLTATVLVICLLPVVMLFRSLFSYLNVYLMNWAAARAIADLRLKLFDHLQNLSLDWFHTARTGNSIARILNDSSLLHNIIGYSFSTMIKDPVTILGLMVLLIWQQPRLTVITLLVFPLCVVPVVVYGRKVRKSAKAVQTHLAELADVMHESFTGTRIVKAYNLEETVLDRFKKSLKNFVSQYMRILRAQETPGPIIEFLGSVGVALVFVYVKFYSKEQVSPGDLLQFVGSVFMMYQPIKALSRLQNQLEQARAASSRIFEMLDTKSSILEPAHPKPLKADGADIHFEDIDFDYGEKPVLRGIQLTVKAGQMVALVGSSGSGKTTIANLLLRFYDPNRGRVRIGSTDIREVSIKDLRSQIALVTQETILFNDTLRYNISLGRPGASDTEVEKAASHAHARDFILEKPLGFETPAGEKGVSLSGGQRQRIAIARALLKDAPILVLDEAMSALDAESERAVQQALDELMEGRTTICIAHKLSTIQKADLIVVLSQGRIVESGSHSDLMRARGTYYRLYELGQQRLEEA
jgi:subfamily B ATP-binding cassette protein MsbA